MAEFQSHQEKVAYCVEMAEQAKALGLPAIAVEGWLTAAQMAFVASLTAGEVA